MVVVMVVVMMVVCRKCGRACKHRQKQRDSENLFLGMHPSRIELVTKAPCCASYLKNNGETETRGVRRSGLLGISTREA